MIRMASITEKNLDVLNKQLSSHTTLMYGAGGNGKKLLAIVKQHNFRVDYFIDDDFTKIGNKFCGLKVISFANLQVLCHKEQVNVILTSVFGGPILKKLCMLQNVSLYEPFELLLSTCYACSFYNKKLEQTKMKTILSQIQQTMTFVEDDESRKVLSTVSHVIERQGVAEAGSFFEVASDEDCYFIELVLAALPVHPVIADCGGFTGDLITALKKHKIDYSKVYSFEVNRKLFDLMCTKIERYALQDRFIPINKGVWDKDEKVYLQVDENDIAGGNVQEDNVGTAVGALKLDSFFYEKKVDFIKMDIEGAELRALQGGIHTIRRDRPILAISLYHSPHDIAEIPVYLHNELTNYKFFVRHHSLIGSETVLYAIPQ